jgi:hypothetical protein
MTGITILAMLTITVVPSAAIAEPIAQSVFEGATAAQPKTGQSFHLSVQSWQFTPTDAVHEIPLRGFYVAHLLSGSIVTTIDGVVTTRGDGAYWTVKAGEIMQVEVLGEFAVLETIVIAKQ